MERNQFGQALSALMLFGAASVLGQAFHPCRVGGTTAPGAWVVANSGEITQADEKGRYEIVFPVQGVYCLKAMKDGFDEAVRPWLVVPAPCDVNLPLWARPNPARRVVHGNLGHPAQLTITDSGQPVRGFDFAGRRVRPPRPSTSGDPISSLRRSSRSPSRSRRTSRSACSISRPRKSIRTRCTRS